MLSKQEEDHEELGLMLLSVIDGAGPGRYAPVNFSRGAHGTHVLDKGYIIQLYRCVPGEGAANPELLVVFTAACILKRTGHCGCRRTLGSDRRASAVNEVGMRICCHDRLELSVICCY